MTPNDYFLHLSSTAARNSFVVDSFLSLKETGGAECYIKGHLVLVKSYVLYMAEFVITGPYPFRHKYRFHLQNATGELVRRWDNAPHHRQVGTFPHHCHLADGRVIASPPMDLQAVLDAIIPLLSL